MRAFFRENETEDYERDLKSAEVLEPFISKGISLWIRWKFLLFSCGMLVT
jgi:hypothetical protein